METVNAIKKRLINTFRVEANYCVELNSLSLTTCPMRPWTASIVALELWGGGGGESNNIILSTQGG